MSAKDITIPETDEGGYLLDWRKWSPAVAEALAGRDGVALGEDHWTVIGILREYFAEYEVAPPVRVLVRLVSERLGGPSASSRTLYRLFPEGPAKQACRYAGLPKPVSCL
jgi:tRNA 2-thiouridine synthesizing protein E